MTTNIKAATSTSGFAVDPAVGDGTLNIMVGNNPATQVAGLSFAADGTPTMIKPPIMGSVVPCFRAYNSSVTSIINFWTKVGLQTKDFDTTNAFDATTNYRFQPTVAGYYQINGTVAFATTSYMVGVGIYKNGSANTYGSQAVSLIATASCVLYLNGSTDYVELYATSATTQNTQTGNALTSLSGALLARSA